MARLGDVDILVYSEKPVRSVKTTDHPVEADEKIVDHIIKNALTVELTGMVGPPDAAVKLRRLEYYQENGIPVAFSGRNYVGDVLIQNFPTVHDVTNKGGFNFTMTLVRIRRANAAQISALKLPVKVQTQTKAVGSKGLQQKQTPAQMAAANNNHVKGYKG